MPQARRWWIIAALATALILLPIPLQVMGTHWVRIADTCLLYVMLALGMNVIIGYAGLLDLGFVAFYAVGAYLFALLSSPHLAEQFTWIAAISARGPSIAWWVILPLAAALAAFLGILLGAPTLKLRGDYLAMVTLGFGEILRILINNLGHPVNITNGAKGVAQIDSIRLFGLDMGHTFTLAGLEIASVSLHYWLFLVLTAMMVLVCHRLQHSSVGRAWMAIRDDEVAAQAMGIHTSRLKLLAFAIGASFGGVSGALFAAFQGFVSPEAFSLQESVVIVAMVVLGGMGHLPGVILGAIVLTGLPEILRYVTGPLQTMTDGRLDAGILRPLLIALAMIGIMLWRPHGLWPLPQYPRQRESGC